MTSLHAALRCASELVAVREEGHRGGRGGGGEGARA